MKRSIADILLLLVITLLPALSWAETYCPKTGEEFAFYPVARVYRQILRGYDCFYDPAKAFKKGHANAIAANRFKPNAQGLTPFSEIEGHTFVVTSVLNENTELTVDKQNFLCFLRRDDGAELLLRLPFVRKTIDNTLTRGMVQILTEKNSFRKGPAMCIINIPACPVDQLKMLSQQMKGQKLQRNKNHVVDLTVKTLTQYLNGAELTESLYQADEIVCDTVCFMEVKGYVYQQPIALAHLNGQRIKLPVFDFRGDGESVYGSYFSINTVFRTPSERKAESVLAEVEEEIEEAEEAEEVVATEPETPRVPITLEPLKKVTTEASQIETPVAKPEVPEMMLVAHVKMAEPSRISVEHKQVEGASVKLDVPEKMEVRAVENTALAVIENKAEEVIAEEVVPAEVTAETRLASLTKRFGAKHAALIAKGKVAKGFTKEMCREALGEPDFVNMTQNLYATLEQWVYGVNLYLYFQKEKLLYIDEF